MLELCFLGRKLTSLSQQFSGFDQQFLKFQIIAVVLESLPHVNRSSPAIHFEGNTISYLLGYG
jgi:hypothetical protein